VDSRDDHGGGERRDTLGQHPNRSDDRRFAKDDEEPLDKRQLIDLGKRSVF
jgi:hypothetical protein